MKSVVYFFLFLTSTIFAQVNIPDPNFLGFLKTNYPQVIDVNGKLKTDEAATITGTFSCANNNISSVEGIQYFTSISVFVCSDNLIQDLSSLSGLNQLLQIYCLDNNLVGLPDLSNFPDLNRLSCDHNNIADFINLGSLSNLTYLSASLNQLTSVEGLDQLINCTNLYLENNKLTQIPDFSAMTSFTQINLSRNKIREIGSISQMTNLQYFYMHHNELSFSALEKIIAHPNLPSPISVFMFDNQKGSYLFSEKRIGAVGEGMLLESPSHFNSVNNDYQWYFNNLLIPGETNSTLQLTNLQLSNSGSYHCQVTNLSSPYLISTFFIIKYPDIEVKCILLDDGVLHSSFEECNSGWDLIIDESQIRASTPVTVTLHSRAAEVDPVSENTFSRLFDRSYTVRVMDENACFIDTVIYQPESPNCDEDLIFTPNGDGLYDQFNIEVTGEAKIYNRYGTLVKTLNTPGAWDGTDLSNALVSDGYYVIIINGETSIRVAVKK